MTLAAEESPTVPESKMAMTDRAGTFVEHIVRVTSLSETFVAVRFVSAWSADGSAVFSVPAVQRIRWDHTGWWGPASKAVMPVPG